MYFIQLFHLTNSLPINLIKVASRWWNQGFYFIFHTKSGFSTFYMALLFTPTANMG